jgi:hypothetical protein
MTVRLPAKSFWVARKECGHSFDLLSKRQPRQFQQKDTADWHSLQNGKLAKVMILRDQDQSRLICEREDMNVVNAPAFLEDRADCEPVFPQPLDDRARHVLVGQEVHAYSAASGLPVPILSAA